MVVVGMGVGGEEVAGRLADAGLSVVGVDEHLVGGECPYYGCIPSKMMLRASTAIAEAGRVGELAGRSEVHPDWRPVAERIRIEAAAGWDDTAAVLRFTDKGGRFVRGRAYLDGPGRVCVDDHVFQARRAVVFGTGTRPYAPPVEGLAGTPYWTNRDAVRLTRLPGSLVVLGGGPMGVEMGQVFARFGVPVTLLEAADRVMVAEEPETSDLVAAALRADGVDLRTGVRTERVDHDGGRFVLRVSDGMTVEAENLLVTTGRRAHLDELRVDSLGLDPRARYLTADDRMRVTDGVWAVGDVTGVGGFTHLAMYQADIAVRDILGQPGPPADYRALPRALFTDPEVGSVGLTEQQAHEAGLDVRIGMARLPTTSRGWIHGVGNEGFVKLVVDRRRDLLVGGTSAGPAGAEVLGALSVAVHGQVPVERLRHMMYAYPTFHRGIQDALREVT